MKIAIYSRKSKYTGKGDSIGNQIQMCKDYIETHYRNKDPEYIIYEDEGLHGQVHVLGHDVPLYYLDHYLNR